MSAPLLTILIPTRNRAHHLATLLPKLLSGLDRVPQLSAEILVCDNRSTDDTAAVVARFSDPRVRYSLNAIGSETAEENIFTNVLNARGTYVWTCSDDDDLTDGFFPRLYDLITPGNLDFILFNAAIIRNDGVVVTPTALSPEQLETYGVYDIRNIRDFVRETGFISYITTVSVAVFKKQFFEGVDWRQYADAYPIYSHSAVYMHAFKDAVFYFEPEPLLIYNYIPDNDERWYTLAKHKGWPAFTPWTLGLLTLFDKLVDNKVIDRAFYYQVREVDFRNVCELHRHTLSILFNQLKRAIAMADPAENFSDLQWQFIVAFHSDLPPEFFNVLTNFYQISRQVRSDLSAVA
jgi:glycosyltransferase involved in cell wall biosynthesis